MIVVDDMPWPTPDRVVLFTLDAAYASGDPDTLCLTPHTAFDPIRGNVIVHDG